MHSITTCQIPWVKGHLRLPFYGLEIARIWGGATSNDLPQTSCSPKYLPNIVMKYAYIISPQAYKWFI